MQRNDGALSLVGTIRKNDLLWFMCAELYFFYLVSITRVLSFFDGFYFQLW